MIKNGDFHRNQFTNLQIDLNIKQLDLNDVTRCPSHIECQLYKYKLMYNVDYKGCPRKHESW